MAIEDCDLVLLQEMLDAVRELCRHLARTLDHLLAVERDTLDVHAESVRVLDEVIDLGRAQECLGRNASPVEADAAQMLPLDDGGLHPELCGTDRGDIAARPAAHDNDIERCVGHSLSPFGASSGLVWWI